MKKFIEPSLEQIGRLKKTLEDADAVIVGAGAGLSTSAGLACFGERFERHFSDFIPNTISPICTPEVSIRLKYWRSAGHGGAAISFITAMQIRPRAGFDKKGSSILSLHCLSGIRCISVGNAGRQCCYGNPCWQQIWYGRGSLPRLLCSRCNRAHPFCNSAYQLCAYHDDLHQECNNRHCFRLRNSEYSENFGNDFGIFQNSH